MTREKAQALLRNYAEFLDWPHMRIADWELMDKYDFKQFINLASLALLLVALEKLRALNMLQQELAG